MGNWPPYSNAYNWSYGPYGPNWWGGPLCMHFEMLLIWGDLHDHWHLISNCHQNVSNLHGCLPCLMIQNNAWLGNLGFSFFNFRQKKKNVGWRIIRMEIRGKSLVYKQWIINTLWICEWYLNLEQNVTLNQKSYKNVGFPNRFYASCCPKNLSPKKTLGWLSCCQKKEQPLLSKSSPRNRSLGKAI